jgi:hypothetical protein
MADSPDVVIKITGDPKDFEKAIEQAKAVMDGFGKKGKESIGIADIALGTFLGHLAEDALSASFEILREGLAKIVEIGKQSIEGAIEQENATSKLNFALAQSGKYSGEASEKMHLFAEELSRTSIFSKVQVTQSAALIESLGNLDEKGLSRATKAAADLASTLRIDLGQASNLLGKAAEGNVEMLHRYGITVENTGNKAKDFANVLSTIESKFGGASENASKTFGGSLEQTANKFKELEESAGDFVIKNGAVIAAIKGVGDFFDHLKQNMLENKDAINDFIEDGIDLLIGSINKAAGAINFAIDALSVMETTWYLVNDAIDAIIQNIAEFEATLTGAAKSITDFLGIHSETLDQLDKGFNNVAEGTKAIRDENEKALLDDISAADKRKELITSVGEMATEAVRKRVDENAEGYAQDQENYLKHLNSKQAIEQFVSAQEKIGRQQDDIELVNQVRETQGRIAALKLQKDLEQLENDGKLVEKKRKIEAEKIKIEENTIFTVKKYEDQTQKEKLANLQSSLGTIATLQSNATGTAFEIGKAAAIANATIDGIAAVQKALASAPPPFNFALAAVVGVATAANVSKIASSKPPTGALEGGIVMDGQFGKDTEPFMLSKGELIAPAKNFDEVVSGVARERGLTGGDDTAETNNLLSEIKELLKSNTGQIINHFEGLGPNWFEDENTIAKVAEKLLDAVQFRNARLAV